MVDGLDGRGRELARCITETDLIAAVSHSSFSLTASGPMLSLYQRDYQF